jgi:outer membrane protein assembly factor BamB
MIRSLTLGLSLVICVAARADEWPDFLGPRRHGISAETGWNMDWNAKEPPVLWRAKVGAGASSCTIVSGKVYTMGGEGDDEWLVCLDAASGNELWRKHYKCEFDKRSWSGGPAGTPVVDGDRVYTLSFRGQLICWNASDGEKRWELNLEGDFKGTPPRWGWAGNPLVLGNMVIVEPGGNGSSRAAVDKLTGKVFWQSGNDPAAYASPVIFSGPGMRGAALFNASGLVCVNPRDGTELFRHEWKTDFGVNAARPIHKEGRFFLSSGYNHGVALVDIQSGVVWENKDIMLQFQSPVLFESHLYFVSGDNSKNARIQCLEWSTGEVKWEQKARGSRGGVIVAGGKLIALTEEGEVILAETTPSAFQELGRLQAVTGTTWAAPAFSDRRLFVRNNAGTLVCLDLNP